MYLATLLTTVEPMTPLGPTGPSGIDVVCVQLGAQNCPIYEVARCVLFRGVLSVLWRNRRDFQNCVLNGAYRADNCSCGIDTWQYFRAFLSRNVKNAGT